MIGRGLGRLFLVTGLLGLAIWAAGCALAYPPRNSNAKPEVLHPTPERLAQLADAPVPRSTAKRAKTVFEIKSPLFVSEGADFWLDCRVPRDIPAGALRFGFGDSASFPHFIRGGERTREGISHRLLVNAAPCGEFTIICALSTGDTITKPLLVKGRCNTESSGEW